MTRGSEAFVAVGALLARATDLDVAARLMQTYIAHPTEANRAALAATGVDTDDARDFLQLVPQDPVTVERVCELARAWTLGRSSVPTEPSWQPVVTSGEVDAHGIDRMTAETMIGLIVGARKALRIFSPFLDPRGSTSSPSPWRQQRDAASEPRSAMHAAATAITRSKDSNDTSRRPATQACSRRSRSKATVPSRISS